MSVNVSGLEFLPNEILIKIFEYFDVQDLFQTFYNLNFRLNTIIASLSHVYLTCVDKTYYRTHSYLPLTTNTSVTDYNLERCFTCFTNIRCLSILQMGDEFSQQINANILPFLEHMVIKTWSETTHSSDYIHAFYKKIFCNTFPYLKSCYLPEVSAMRMTDEYMEVPSLNILQTGTIDCFIYKSILKICPNLNLFKFMLQQTLSETLVVIKPHLNLKQMIIKIKNYTPSENNLDIDTCLSFVPNLEKLIIGKTNIRFQVKKMKNYDWYASSIVRYLPLLHRFKYYIEPFLWKDDDYHKNLIEQMKEIFIISHKNGPYQSKLILDTKSFCRAPMCLFQSEHYNQ